MIKNVEMNFSSFAPWLAIASFGLLLLVILYVSIVTLIKERKSLRAFSQQQAKKTEPMTTNTPSLQAAVNKIKIIRQELAFIEEQLKSSAK